MKNKEMVYITKYGEIVIYCKKKLEVGGHSTAHLSREAQKKLAEELIDRWLKTRQIELLGEL